MGLSSTQWIVFWTKYIEYCKLNHGYHATTTPVNKNCLSRATGLARGAHYDLCAYDWQVRVELYLCGPTKEYNKDLYDYLYAHKDTIEKTFGGELKWERLDSIKSSKVSFATSAYDPNSQGDWLKIFEFFMKTVARLDRAVSGYLSNY